MIVSIIVACDPLGVIGKNGKLPWRLPEDLRMFRDRTMHRCIIMGRKTWESLPKKPLDGRANIVISRSKWEKPVNECGPFWYGSIEQALENVKKSRYETDQVFIIGGRDIYKTAIDRDLVDCVIMSKIHKTYEGDVTFPTLEENWSVLSTEYKDGFDVVYIVNKAKQAKSGTGLASFMSVATK